MGIAYSHHYICRPKPVALRPKAPFSRHTQRALSSHPLVFHSHQGAPPGASYDARAKLVFLLRLKQTVNDPAITNAPVSTTFFDAWFQLETLAADFTLDDVLSAVEDHHLDHPETSAEARALFARLLPIGEPRGRPRS